MGTLVLATRNEGKVRELRSLLRDLDRRVVSPRDLGLSLAIEETGNTFTQNARLKARAYFQATGLPSLGEDSGIEIDALRGEPGILSARYHGLPDGPEKNAHVLLLLEGVPPGRRGCRYACAMVLCEGDGHERVFLGECSGRIAIAPAGRGGFGFDPIVLIPRLGRTMAELSDDEKNRHSHRGRAARKLLRYLQTL